MGADHAKSDGDSLDAVLVRSAREGGRVRQKYVCYLASISESGLRAMFSQSDFWAAVTVKLDGLGLAAAERQKLEGQLLKVVARPDPAEVAAARARSREFFAPLRQFLESRRRGPRRSA